MIATYLDRGKALIFGKLLGIGRDEYAAVAWSFAYFFCVLSSYYVLRPVRETMGVVSGPNTILYLFMGTFITMLLVTPIFGWVTSRYPRRRFLPWTYLFFIVNILIFWAAFHVITEDSLYRIWLGRVFFVWLSIFNLFVVSVFWSFMADIYTREQGRRLFGFITAGGSIGALLGGIATQVYVVEIGRENLFPIAGAILLCAVYCIYRLRDLSGQESVGNARPVAANERLLGGNPFAGITHVMRSRYFSAIAVSSVIASILGTALYMFTARLVEQQIPDPDYQTRFFAMVNNWQNLIALVIQMLAVQRVVRRWGIGISLALMPVISVAGFAILALAPSLAAVAFLTVVRRSIGFGFMKPTTDMLYSVVTPEDKYKTKNFIDTAVYRAGDVLGILTEKLLVFLGAGISIVSLVMVPIAAIWGTVVLWMGRDYRRRAKLLRASESNAQNLEST